MSSECMLKFMTKTSCQVVLATETCRQTHKKKHNLKSNLQLKVCRNMNVIIL